MTDIQRSPRGEWDGTIHTTVASRTKGSISPGPMSDVQALCIRIASVIADAACDILSNHRWE